MCRVHIYITCLVKELPMCVINIKSNLKLVEFPELLKRQMRNSFLIGIHTTQSETTTEEQKQNQTKYGG